MTDLPHLKEALDQSQAGVVHELAYKSGDLYLGYIPDKSGKNAEIGVRTKRHAITIGGARSGKGAAVIIPNLLRWPHNAIVIDPKGEAAKATAEIREGMGQSIHVIDPFGVAEVPERFLSRFNPLERLRTDDPNIREDIEVIVDGLVMRHDPKSAHWDGGAASVLAGVIGYLIDQAPPERRTLGELRDCLTLPSEAFASLIAEMSTNGACGGLPAAAAARLTRSGTEAGHFLSNADENTKWLGDGPVRRVLEKSTFDLADIKHKPMTVYLVLPSRYVSVHGRFLRLFVRSAISAMARDLDGRETLFCLDEFYTLGRIDEIAKAAGLMPGYGVKLWPILQDLGQLIELYGREGAGTFFGNSDLHQFFGNVDRDTLEHISVQAGTVSLDDIPPPPDAPMSINTPGVVSAASAHSRNSGARVGGALWGAWAGGIEHFVNAARNTEYQNNMNEYQRIMSRVGKRILEPSDVASLVRLKDDVVADGSLCVIYGSEMLYVQLAPYFREIPQPDPPMVIVPPSKLPMTKHIGMRLFFAAFSFFLWSGIVGVVFGPTPFILIVALIAAGVSYWRMSL